MNARRTVMSHTAGSVKVGCSCAPSVGKQNASSRRAALDRRLCMLNRSMISVGSQWSRVET